MNNVIDLDDYSVCDACGYDRRDYEESGEYVDQVGDIVENHIGVAVLTPHGWWQLTDEQALSLNAGLSNMINSRLTRPWSNDDPSTIITRGREALMEIEDIDG
ncbi:hypothetical protein CpMRi49_08230 [Corynebacterium ulcerans]|uniref:hypothetical protein n=1 Tax=Corynebacterium ulcerans TaxID=65058 RepID=UPI00052A2F1C|nr:hypothetical protein [Corynebacterium ulcerans]AIU92220.1 Hypothetical protein Cul05146_1661 [Corynebacterium ulcerans]KPH73879.1 hypothetical protein AFK72_11285 [Corynebacterium ulcerans]MBL4943312.1 hypothetical protein [Corynebacterium ulcerans]OIS06652.1 hypothetical protein BHG00_03960 [Corynebacterium ulcerans]QGZ25932.1 hypothetical protein CpMRi49_08230 [Corynebacterium ulcerans]